MSRTRRPEHPFPFLERGTPSPYPVAAFLASPVPQRHSPRRSGGWEATSPRQSIREFSAPSSGEKIQPTQPIGSWLVPPSKTPAMKKFSNMLRRGARVVLDLDTGKCLLYSFSNGIQVLGTLTIRTLSQLLRLGDLVMAARENRWIHFAYPGSNLAWFQPES